MKNERNWLSMFAMILMGSFVMLSLNSCEDDDDPLEDPIATFQYEISGDNPLQVIFTNFSSNADTYAWDFGDGNTSAEENPTHTYEDFGVFEVLLTATNADGASASFAEEITIQDPDEALTLLTGETSKTWRLYREGEAMGVGPDLDNPYDWWFLMNDGDRPCLYYHEFTFHKDGQYTFDHKGSFWGEFGVFGGVEGEEDTPVYGECFEAVPENMVNVYGDDVSAWLDENHQFEFNSANNMVTLNGEGAWIGIPKLGTDGEYAVPQNSVSFKVTVEERDGYDHMLVEFDYDGAGWAINYAHYHDASLEPPVEEEPQEWGEDLPNITPDEIFVTFAARDAENMATIDTITSGSSVVFGVEDPTDADAQLVGEFIRTGGVEWQELQFRTSPELYDIQFDNFNTASIDIFIPGDTNFEEGGLQRHFAFGFADMSATQSWWDDPVEFITEGDDVVVGEWTTYTFDLTEVKERDDLDMIFLGIGGGGHEEEGIFYVRNLIFE